MEAKNGKTLKPAPLTPQKTKEPDTAIDKESIDKKLLRHDTRAAKIDVRHFRSPGGGWQSTAKAEAKMQ